MSKIMVMMLVIGWGPQPDGHMKELWRIEKRVTLLNCLEMNQTFTDGASNGVVTVKCGVHEAGDGTWKDK